MRVAVLASGTGTILEAILADGLPIAVVLADRPCRALQVASAAGVATEVVDRELFGGFGPAFDREGFTAQVVEVLAPYGADMVAMAGFGTVLARPIFDAYPATILNTHPALLPSFPGWHAVEDALFTGAKVTGCTVHIATLDTDSGPVLAQQQVPVLDSDDVTTLHERIKEVERVLYPKTIRQFLERLGTSYARERTR